MIWYESILVDCEECRECTKDECHYIGDYQHDWVKCQYRIPRPCPLTAHPVREIEITESSRILGSDWDDIRNWRNELVPKYGIEFTIV